MPDQNSLDPISQLQELLQIVCSMASGKGKLKGNSNELTEEECKNYENLLQKLEGEIRNHIGVLKHFFIKLCLPTLSQPQLNLKDYYHNN